MNAAEFFPFAQEFIKDAEGRICKVILDVEDYKKLIESLEDEGLYRAMNDVRNETPLSLEEALQELEQS